MSRSGRLKQLALTAVLGVICVSTAGAQIDEYRMKAAFLYNFAKFVAWPAKSFHSPSEPIVICILGQNPFKELLAEAIQGKVLGARPFVVRLISDLPAQSGCQVLFINWSDRQRFRSMAGSLKGRGILTVGEAPWFIDEGGIINFKLQEDSLRFEISVEAAEQAHVSISSRLLELAQIRK